MLEEKVEFFLMSKLNLFKRIDYEITMELVAKKNNIPLNELKQIVQRIVNEKKTISIKNESFILNENN